MCCGSMFNVHGPVWTYFNMKLLVFISPLSNLNSTYETSIQPSHMFVGKITTVRSLAKQLSRFSFTEYQSHAVHVLMQCIRLNSRRYAWQTKFRQIKNRHWKNSTQNHCVYHLKELALLAFGICLFVSSEQDKRRKKKRFNPKQLIEQFLPVILADIGSHFHVRCPYN